MRFRFCGDLEPPDWLLAELPLLAAIDEAQVTAVCQCICSSSSSETAMGEMAPLDPQDAQAIAAVLRFALFQAAKYDVSQRELSVELLQLGLRREICDGVAAVYGAKRPELRTCLQAASFQFPTITQLQWRVDPTNTSPEAPKAKRVEMRLQLDRPTLLCDDTGIVTNGSLSKSDGLTIQMTQNKFLALYEELTQAKAVLQSLQRS